MTAHTEGYTLMRRGKPLRFMLEVEGLDPAPSLDAVPSQGHVDLGLLRREANRLEHDGFQVMHASDADNLV